MDQTPQNMKRGERIIPLKGHLVTTALIFVRMGWAGMGKGGGRRGTNGVKVANTTSEGGAELQQIRTWVRLLAS